MEDVQPQRNCAVDVLTFALSACPTFKKILLSCDQALSGHANDINQLITFFEKCNAGRLSLHIPKLVDQEVRTLEDLHLLNDDDLIEIGLSRDDAKLLYKLLQNIGRQGGVLAFFLLAACFVFDSACGSCWKT